MSTTTTTDTETFQAWAAKVADNLPGWSLVAPGPDTARDRWAEFERDADGARIHMTTDTYGPIDKRRVEVSGNWWAPADANGRREYLADSLRDWDHERNERRSLPRISIGRTREPAAAARDIARRFLPAWEPMHERYVAILAARDDYRTRHAATVATIAAALGQTPRRDDDRPARFYVDAGSVDVDGDNVRIELRTLSPERALAVLAAITTTEEQA